MSEARGTRWLDSDQQGSWRAFVVGITLLLDRLEGCARAQSGDVDGAWSAWDRSLAASRERGADYETALTLDLMARTALDLGRDEGAAMADEARAIFDRLGVDALSVRQPT